MAVALLAGACGDDDSSNEAAPTTTAASGTETTGATTTTVAAPTKAAIKIGSIGSYSGFAGATSKATSDAVEAWAKWINAKGGIDGHPVEVVVKDDAGDAGKSIAAVKDLVENEHVVAIVGQHESGLEAGWAEYIDGQKIPVIGGPASGTTWLSDANFFPTSPTPINVLTLYANTTLVAGAKTYGILYCAEAPACANAGTYGKNVAEKALGLTYAGHQAISASAPNYTALCLTMRDNNAEMLFSATSQETTLRFISDCSKQGYKPNYVIGAQSWSQDQLDNDATDGLWMFSDNFLWFGDGPGTADFLAAMEEYAPDTPLNASATSGWAAAVALGDALANGVSETPTSADVYAGLYALGADYDGGGIIPPVTFAEGQPAVQKTCGWYAQVKDGTETAPKGTAPVCITPAS